LRVVSEELWVSTFFKFWVWDGGEMGDGTHLGNKILHVFREVRMCSFSVEFEVYSRYAAVRVCGNELGERRKKRKNENILFTLARSSKGGKPETNSKVKTPSAQ
jgi:hypothetical protein